jgi:bifunctional DNase/RNase
MNDLIEVVVKRVSPDIQSGQYKVVLQDRETGRILLIWVGHFEGNAISLGLEDSWTPRPMTHDLIGNIIQGLQATVTRVVITDLRQNTFYAVITITCDGREAAIDSRPSDAIAVAIRQKAPIFVSRELADKMIDEVDEIFESLQAKDTVH